MSRDAVGTNNEVLTVNKTQLVQIQMNNWPNDNRGIVLVYATGTETAGEFTPVKRHQLAVKPAEFIAFMATTDLAGKAFVDALKDFCYQQIQDAATAV